MTQGIIYYATGERYLKEATLSARSVKNEMPGTSVAVFTDQETTSPVFDEIVTIESKDHPFLHRIRCFQETPFDKTLYLDTDTYMAGNVSELFELLDVYDIGMSYVPAYDPKARESLTDEVPEAFPLLNCGVILYTKSDGVLSLFKEWEELYRETFDQTATDQPALRELIYYWDGDLFVLPPKYNCRFDFPGTKAGRAKILHGRHDGVNMAKMAEQLNKTREQVVFTGNNHRRIIRDRALFASWSYPPPSRIMRLINKSVKSVKQDGPASTCRKIFRNMSLKDS